MTFRSEDMHSGPQMSPHKKGKYRLHPEMFDNHPNAELDDEGYRLSPPGPPPPFLSRIGAAAPVDVFTQHFYEDLQEPVGSTHSQANVYY
jgi:hypothetical protein